MARFFKFYKCQKGSHILCAGIIGEKDNPLSMVCDCEYHKEKEIEIVKNQTAQGLKKNPRQSQTETDS
jgi:hypothetical protein